MGTRVGKCVSNFRYGKLMGRSVLEDLDSVGKIKLDLNKMTGEYVDWIYLDQYRNL